MRVIEGRFTRSRSASSEGVSGPERLIVASAAVPLGLSPVSAVASWRSAREVRTIASRRCEAVSVSEVSVVLAAM